MTGGMPAMPQIPGLDQFRQMFAGQQSPRLTIGAMPQLSQPAQTAASAAPDTNTVEARLARLQQEDSALMRGAIASGLRMANRRGLINSTMGIGAGISAGLGAVMPIAQQDSQQGVQSRLAAAEDARLRSLASSEDKRARDLSKAEDQRVRDLTASDEKLKRELSASEDARVRELAAAEDKRQRELTAANIASNDRGNYAQAITSMGANYQQAISNTLQNDKIPDSTRSAAQSDIATVYKGQQEQLAKFYGVELSWSNPA